MPGTNHPVDAVWQTKDHIETFQVVIGCEDNLVSHLTACFINSDAVHRVTIVAPQKSKLAEPKQAVDTETTLKPFADRIEYLPVESILTELWP